MSATAAGPSMQTQGDSTAGATATASVGMVVGLSALGMTFAALLLAYGIVRVQAPAWPPPGEVPLPALWAWRLAATAASIAGSAMMVIAARRGRHASSARVARALAGAAAAGAAFLALQAASFVALARAGIRPSSGLGASVVYALGLFHGLHVLAALVTLLPVALAMARGRRVSASRLRSLAAFWHLVTAVWVAVFLAVFVA